MSAFRLYDLNPEQYEAATHGDGPMLILAGAGTGKTRVITARIAWLVAQGVAPSQILAVTFTNKAAKEMKERVAGMLSAEQAKEITTSTFHAMCVRMLRQDAEKLGYKNNFSIYDESDQMGLIKKIINRVTAKDEKLDPFLAKNLISKAKNNGWNAPAEDETVIGAVYRRYQRELRTLNAMDFDDLLIEAVRLLQEHPDVRDKWRNRYRHLLVDEFQDTNRLQLEMVSHLTGNPPNICVVGDDDQSIYGWRGAEVSNILEFEKHFPDPKVVRLEQNYRSTNVILNAANRLIKNNTARRGKNLWSASKGGESIRVLSIPDDRTEAEFLVNEIYSKRAEFKIEWEHFAVLYRMNAQSRVLEEALRKRKIPYRLIGGKSFFDRREVKDVLAYIACILNPEDDNALLRIINTPPRGIGPTTIELAFEKSAQDHCSLRTTLADPGFQEGCTRKAATAIRQFLDTLDAARIRSQIPGADNGQLVHSILADCGYMDDLKRSCKTTEEAMNREENVLELMRALSEHQKRSKDGLQGFLDSMNLDREREEKDDSGLGVTLITLHAAKGLEFPHVFLVGAEDGIVPHQRSREEGTLDEERRLFYVGITRAMKTLTVTHCQSRMRYGSATYCKSSPFLAEIEGEGIETMTYHEFMSKPASAEAISAQFSQLKAMLRSS